MLAMRSLRGWLAGQAVTATVTIGLRRISVPVCNV